MYQHEASTIGGASEVLEGILQDVDRNKGHMPELSIIGLNLGAIYSVNQDHNIDRVD